MLEAASVQNKRIYNFANECYYVDLLLQFYLSLCDKSSISSDVISGMDNLVRGISSGKQTFETDPDTYPVSKAVPKLHSNAGVN